MKSIYKLDAMSDRNDVFTSSDFMSNDRYTNNLKCMIVLTCH